MCGSSLEAQLLWHAHSNVVHGCNIVDAGSLFAREVRSIRFQWAVGKTALAVRNWRGNHHVSIDARGKQSTGGGRNEEGFGQHDCRKVVLAKNNSYES